MAGARAAAAAASFRATPGAIASARYPRRAMTADADDSAPPAGGDQPCMACRGTGQVTSTEGGESRSVECPWCKGTGQRIPGLDAQAHWREAQAGEGGGGGAAGDAPETPEAPEAPEAPEEPDPAA